MDELMKRVEREQERSVVKACYRVTHPCRARRQRHAARQRAPRPDSAAGLPDQPATRDESGRCEDPDDAGEEVRGAEEFPDGPTALGAQRFELEDECQTLGDDDAEAARRDEPERSDAEGSEVSPPQHQNDEEHAPDRAGLARQSRTAEEEVEVRGHDRSTDPPAEALWRFDAYETRRLT